MSGGNLKEPTFPPELEREILEFAAFGDPSRIPTLLLVCRRVHRWLEPLVYRVLRLDKLQIVEPLAHALKSKPPGFLGHAVKHALVTVSYTHWTTASAWETLSEILLLNPNIFELVIKKYTSYTSNSSLRRIPTGMHPKRLIVQFTRDSGCDADLTEPLFSCVSHLTLCQASPAMSHETWDMWSHLATLPMLTHLCFTENIARGVLHQVLTECPNLLAVVILWQINSPSVSKPRMDAFARSTLKTNADPRVVLVTIPRFYDDWERGAWSGDDLWFRVDDFIAGKRRGIISDSTHVFE
ncbi:hypothetical protein R3P38DRAFT_325628, partial [Favolaschia claudopus]